MKKHVLHVTHDYQGEREGDHPGKLWMNSNAQCLNCGLQWLATHPADCGALICPDCECIDTVREEAEL